jgi:RNA recognition motif-containing protein
MTPPVATKISTTRFFVKDLPPSFRDEQLQDLLAPFGTVIRACIITTTAGEALPLAYVEMSQPEEVVKAVKSLHKIRIDGDLLTLGYL